VAVLYACWLIYAGGMQYVLLSSLLYAPGAVFYAMARRERGAQVFTRLEAAVFAVVLVGAIAAAYGLATGQLHL
jgi:arginine:ornithine antiporter/lysine permease